MPKMIGLIPIIALGLFLSNTTSAHANCDRDFTAATATVIEDGVVRTTVVGKSSCSAMETIARALTLAAEKAHEVWMQYQADQAKAIWLMPNRMINSEHEQFEAMKNCQLGKEIGTGCEGPLGTRAFVQASPRKLVAK